MKIKLFLKKLDFGLEKKEISEIRKRANYFVEMIKKSISRNGIDADVFVGGSFAKGTITKNQEYDIDIFVRFGWKYESLSDILEGLLRDVGKSMKISIFRMHGSRDYFRFDAGDRISFEIIPVVRIKKVREARNVTDLSYFHVNYVKRNLNKNIAREINLVKKFCKARRVYGAESYINGFSGYGLECLIIYYKSFEKMIRELVKIKERIVIDPAKHYKKKENVFYEMNESKLNGPIILVDPTWKERNVLAALNWESFMKFQSDCKRFLKNPSGKFFEFESIDEKKILEFAKSKKAEFVHVILETNRQEGDIAGTKLKKFAQFLEREISKYFEVLSKEFSYSLGRKADFYIVAKSKREIIRIGPPKEMKKGASEFRKKNKNVFEKNGILHAKVRVDFSTREFLEKFSREEKKKINEMSITNLSVKT
ncbi:MAG: nucleotidyltransferase domain-containing protein [Nanoarchaeota archaeon]